MAVFNEPTKWAQTLGKDADVVTIPDIAGDTDPSIDKIFPSVFSIPLARGGKAIPRSVLNGLFKLLGDWAYYSQNGGVSTYSADFDYVAGRVVLYNGNLYKCIQANGTSSTVVAPDSSTEYWQRLDNFVRSVNGVNADAEGNVKGFFPSSTFISITATNLAEFIAPTNGWIYLGGIKNTSGTFGKVRLSIYSGSTLLREIDNESSLSNNMYNLITAVSKGERVVFNIFNTSNVICRFAYAQGEEP